MKYSDLQIQTQREAPNNARTEGFSFLVRAGYLTRENVPTKLGEQAISHIRELAERSLHSLSTIGNDQETFFPIASGNMDIAHCSSCKYTEKLEFAKFAKPATTDNNSPLLIEKVSTPDCNTIESLANLLNIKKEETAKALMYTRVSDGKFIFVVVRGDMQISEAKLTAQVGNIRAATNDEIISVGAVPGYASAIGLNNEAMIVVDNLIPQSKNLVAGANEAGYHLKNTNHGRDYSAEIVADLVQAQEGDACANCGNPISMTSSIQLATRKEFEPENILLALAEEHHDDYGLTIPQSASLFDIYLMHIPGKELDTRKKADEIYNSLQDASLSVLFDDRDERAGIKFNDADLIGCPIRVTVGEKGLKDGLVELKPRKEKEKQLVLLEELVENIKSILNP